LPSCRAVLFTSTRDVRRLFSLTRARMRSLPLAKFPQFSLGVFQRERIDPCVPVLCVIAATWIELLKEAKHPRASESFFERNQAFSPNVIRCLKCRHNVSANRQG